MKKSLTQLIAIMALISGSQSTQLREISNNQHKLEILMQTDDDLTLSVREELNKVLAEKDDEDKPKPKPKPQKAQVQGPDHIETSTNEDMFAFSQIVASGGNVMKAAQEIEEMEKQQAKEQKEKEAAEREALMVARINKLMEKQPTRKEIWEHKQAV